MTTEQAARFVNDWPTLVPSYLPEPFASAIPSISVTGTTYQLYWLILGGPPTFLVVSGDTSGYIPAGSIYDLNVELVVNATVRGNAAYHDPTPIYDTVYWREGGIVYTASSRGLSTDIVSYANGFTRVSAPAPTAPTATVIGPATLFSPDTLSSGAIGTVTARGGGTGAILTADGGVFADTGTATYPGAGDAAVTWVAPNVAVDTVVTFSLLDANGGILVSTPTLVTAARPPPVTFGLDCAPAVAAGETLAIAVSGSGNVMLGSSDGDWPRMSPNTDYDPGTDGGSLAFSMGAGGTATLVWAAPATPGSVTLTASGPSGISIASCQIEVLGAAPTGTAPTAPTPASTVITAPTSSVATVTTRAAIATAPIRPPDATMTASGTATLVPPVPTVTVAAVATGTRPGTNPGDGTETGLGQPATTPAAGPRSTVPGTNPGDGIDAGQGAVPPSSTVRSGDGTDFGGVATVPPAATYPAIPTSAALPAAPPTSVPPSGAATRGAGQNAVSTSPTIVPPASTLTAARTVPAPTATPSRSTATVVPSTAPAAPATIAPPTRPTAVAPATPTVVRPTGTLPTSIPSRGMPTPTVRPTSTTLAQPALTSTPLVAPLLPGATSTPARTATVAPPPATIVPPTVTALPASPIPPTATATQMPPTATAARRPPATATSTPVRPGQGAETVDASPVLATATLALPATASVLSASPTAPPPTPTEPSVTIEAMEQEIGPAGGTVEHPAGGQLTVAEGTFGSTMVVVLAQLPDTVLPVSADVELIPSTGYEIEIRAADGAAMMTLPAGVTLNLAIPEAQRSEAVVYWIDGDRLERLADSSSDGAGISVPLAHLSRYVAGIPVEEKPQLGWLPWTVAIAAAMSGLMVVGLLARKVRGQPRSRSVRHGA